MADITFDQLGQGQPAQKPTGKIGIREMTLTDQLTDVGWVEGDLKERMKAIFMEKFGQYFDCGVRVTVGDAV